MTWWRSHSLRVRLTIWYVVVMVVVLGVYAAAVLTFVRQTASDDLDGRLRSDFQWAAAMVELTPEGGFTWYEETFTEEDAPWLQVWSPEGVLLYANSEATRNPIAESRSLALQGDDRIVAVPGGFAPVRILSRRGRIDARPVVIQVARSEAPMQAEVADLLLILLLGMPLAVAVAGLGGYTVARRALAPVERMSDRARSITAERLHDRLPVANPDDEMGRLATVFNETLARLERSFEQMRRFTADVSHELRTPLTAIRSVGEVGLREHRNEDAYRSIIGSMLEESDRLAGLVERLLALSRTETGQAQVSMEEIDLHELAADVSSHLGVLAEEKGQSITVESHGHPRARANRTGIRQAAINLVDNAIKFSPARGRIRIRVLDTADAAMLDVIDSGPGIDEASQVRVFDRFYRAGEGNGTGLGLSIAKGAVEANGGRLSLEHSDPAGSTFRITLPRVAARQTAG